MLGRGVANLIRKVKIGLTVCLLSECVQPILAFLITGKYAHTHVPQTHREKENYSGSITAVVLLSSLWFPGPDTKAGL